MIRSIWKEFKKEGHTHNCAHETVGSDQYMYKDKVSYRPEELL